MKRKILAIATLVIFAALLVSGTLAYFTAEDRAVNVITIGSVDIEIVEYAKDGSVISDTSTGHVNMPEYFDNVEPGMRLVKLVTIENRGKNTAWIRVKIVDSIISAGGGALSTGVLSYNVNELATITSENEDKYNLDGKWEDGGDGYWYYSEPLEPGEIAVLFDVVTFDGPSMGNNYQDCETNIKVLAQAVQYEGNENRSSESWPADPEYVTGGEQP